MANKRGGLEVLTETFKAERISKDLVEQVSRRGVDIAYQWLEGKARLGDTEALVEVDGRTGRLIESWRRKIRISWASAAQLQEITRFLYNSVVKRTPVDSGRLAMSWTWMYNGKFFPLTALMPVIRRFKAGDELRLINLQPYARKANQLYVPKGIVGPVARSAKKKFRGFIVVEDWIEVPGHVFARGIRATSGRERGWTGKKGKRVYKSAAQKTDQRVPSILVKKSGRSISTRT